jgi:hypothetical protein
VPLPNDRNSLVRYCLRKLGAPVLDINLDESQIEDCVDEALEMFKEYHVDGTKLFYKRFKLDGSHIHLTAPLVGEIGFHEMFKGQTSGAVARFEKYHADDQTIEFTYFDPAHEVLFLPGEQIQSQNSLVTATIAPGPTSVYLGAIDKKYLELDSSVVAVLEVLRPRSTFGSHPVNPFDLQYQLAQNVTIQTFLNADVVTYYMFQHDVELWHQLFEGTKQFWHSRKENRLYLHVNWHEEFKVGQWMVLQYWAEVDPDEVSKVWGDKWLRRYLTALLMVQWGQNLSKYQGVQLPGGVMLNGAEILDRGEMLRAEALEDLRSTYEFKTPFIIA